MRVLVTGARGGIGSVIVSRLVSSGHDVLSHDVVPPSAPDGALGFAGDLLAPDDLAALLGAACAGPLDAVIAAHGIGGPGAVRELTRDYVERVMRINFLSVTTLYDAVATHLARAGGRFVAVSSQAGLRGEAYNSAYCASKFALVGWAQALAAGGHGEARVRVLCPGATDAGMFRGVAENQAASDGVDVDEIVRRRVTTIALGRLAAADEVAAAAIWLAELRTTAATTIAFNGGDALY